MAKLCEGCNFVTIPDGSVYCAPCVRRNPVEMPLTWFVVSLERWLGQVDVALNRGDTQQALRCLHHAKTVKDALGAFTDLAFGVPLRRCSHCARGYTPAEIDHLPAQTTARGTIRTCLCGGPLFFPAPTTETRENDETAG